MHLQLQGDQLRRFAASGRPADLAAPDSLGAILLESTKLAPLTGRAYAASILELLRTPFARVASRPAKVYSLGPSRPLPPVPARHRLEHAVERRRSTRRYAEAPLEARELAHLLRFSYGVTESAGRRPVPSAGALYPLEVYVVALRVDGLAPGVYHYDPAGHALDAVDTGDPRAELAECVSFTDVDLERAAMVLIVTALPERTAIKYGNRGYRLVLMEAGCVIQSLCLVATALELAICPLGGFFDDRLARFLGSDPLREIPLVPLVVGRPRREEAA